MEGLLVHRVIAVVWIDVVWRLSRRLRRCSYSRQPGDLVSLPAKSSRSYRDRDLALALAAAKTFRPHSYL